MPLCKHVAEWKQERGGRLAYRPLQKGFLAQDGNTVQLGSSCVCLHCAAAESSFTKLQISHSNAGQLGHIAACDTRRRELYCFACSDYVYDEEFDAAMLGVSAVKLNVPAHKQSKVIADIEPSQNKADTALAGGAASAAADAKARAISKAHSSPYGLRGLSNLGNTCFMNSVLQAMVHAPLLRNFYLSGGHPRSQCKHRLAKPCLSCELDGIVSASYSGATQPFSPAAFLHAWWRHADHHLASYQQQDAHEFYLYALAGLGQSRLLPEEDSVPASAPAPFQEKSQHVLQQEQLPQMKQEPDRVSQPAGQLLQQAQPQPAKPEPKEEDCLLLPSQHALHACLAEPLHRGLVTSGVRGSQLHGSHGSSAALPSRYTNGHTTTSGDPQAARLNHNMAAPNPFIKGSFGQHNSSAPHQQRPVPQYSMANPPYSCHTQYQDVRSGGSGGSPLPSSGQGQDAVPFHPKSGQPGPQQQASQRQSHSSGHPMLNHSMQHSSAAQYSNGHPQSLGSGMQQTAPWPQQQQQRQSAPMSQQPDPSGQQMLSNGLQQSTPEPASSSATWQRHSQQPSMLGGQRAPQVKQEPPGFQHSNHALPQPGSWQPGKPGMAAQQAPYQHPQSTGGTSHSQPQRQNDTHSPSSLPIPQNPYQQRPSHPAHSLPMQRQGSQGRPLTIQEQFLALQQDSQPLKDPPGPLPNGSAEEQAKPVSPSQSGCSESESIVQRIFGGVLQSEVICSACCHISTAHDPFLDISLDIGAPPLPPPPMLKPPSHSQHRHPGGPKRLTGAAAMAVAAAQKRAAVSAPAEVSANGTPEPHGPAAPPPPPHLPHGGRLSADVASAPDSRAPSDPERISPDIDVVSIAGDVLSQRALSDNNGSMDKSGSQNAEEAARSWQGTPVLEEPLTRRGSTEADVPTYRASPTQASERDFASTTRDPMCSEGASSGIVGNSQDVDEAMSTPTARLKQRPGSSGAGRGRPSSSGGKRPSRCMQCATCMKPQLKKACLRNKALRSMGSLDRLPSLDAVSIEVPPPEPFSRPSPSPDAASTPSKASAHRIRSEEDGLEPSSRSPSLTFPTRACLPQPETPHGIPMTPLTANGTAPKQQQGASGKLPKLPGSVSLLGCLQRFVRPERLGTAEQWVCGGCSRLQHAVKQMSVHRLPPVLCLHVKRFEHTGVGKKLYTPLDFTAYLDMRPYLSSSVMHARLASQGLQGRQQGRGALPAVPPQRAQHDADPCMYELYTVVCHRGNLQGGHYVSYVKCKDAWYLCDDNAVFQVDELTACCPSAYMLFYRQLAIQS